jgi:hypothetical protein
MPVRLLRLLVGDEFVTSRLVSESAPSPLVLMNEPTELVILLRVKSKRPTRFWLLESR